MSFRRPNLQAALAVMSPDIAQALREGSRFLRERGIAHALCGGIAVSAYARPRATKDVDFLVGEDAYEHHGAIVVPKAPSRVGAVAVDSVPLEPELHALADVLASPEIVDGIPIVSAQALIAMKLVAGRMQDQADVVALLESGAVDVDECRGWLQARGFDIAGFDHLVQKARGS